MRLNLNPMEQPTVSVYLYSDAHVVIPRYSTGVFGSIMKTIKMKKGESYYGKFYVRKNRVMAVDREGQRCSKGMARTR